MEPSLSISRHRTASRRVIAFLVCRLYAVLPCAITPLLAGVLVISGHGPLIGLAVVALSFIAMAVRFPEFVAKPGIAVLNACLFLAVVIVPSLVIADHEVRGGIAGAVLGGFLSVAVLWVQPKLPTSVASMIQPELFPDVLTGLFLTLLFAIPVSVLKAREPSELAQVRPPFRVSIILCAYEEDETIDRSLSSLRAAVKSARISPLILETRLVLVDSSRSDTTRLRLAACVDRMVEGRPGKLSARDQGMRLEDSADLFVAADADREYEADWLLKLVAPFAKAGVVATMGETRNLGASMSASAWCRATLKMPYNGGNSAFLKRAYREAPFDTSIDQSVHRRLWLEEEFLLGLTLMAQGEVVHVQDCRSYEVRPYPLLDQLKRHLLGVRLRTF